MAPGPLTDVSFKFGSARADVNDRDLPAGTLVRRRNCRIDVDGKLEKRTGYTRDSAPTFAEGGFLGPMTHLYPGATGTLGRDSGHQLWLKDGATARLRFSPSGSVDALPSWFGLGDASATGEVPRKPLSVICNGDTWHFHAGKGTSGANNADLQLSVVNNTTGALKERMRSVLVNSGGAPDYTEILCGAVDGTTVWLFVVKASTPTVITSLKFTSTSGSPTIAAYYSNAALEFTSGHARTLPNGDVMVAFTHQRINGANFEYGHVITRLNKTTGATAAATVSTTTQATATSDRQCTGMCIADPDGTNAIHLTYFRPSGSVVDQSEMVRHTIDSFTLAPTSTVALQTDSGADTWRSAATASFVSGSDVYAVATDMETRLGVDPLVSAAASTEVFRFGASSAKLSTRYREWVASTAIKLGTIWVYIAGYADAERKQRTYWLKAAINGAPICPIMQGEAGEMFHMYLDVPTATTPWSRQGHVQTLSSYVDGSGKTWLVTGLLREASHPRGTVMNHVAIETSPRGLWSKAPGLIPGGIPKWAGARDMAAELAPHRFPAHNGSIAPGVGGADAAGTYSTNNYTHLFAARNSDGEWRFSTPRATVQHAFPNRVGPDPSTWTWLLSFETMEIQLPLSEIWILIFGSVSGGSEMYLQHIARNDSSALNYTWETNPTTWTAEGELLYTTGALLRANDPVPPCRGAFVHDNRGWLCGIPGAPNELWHSQEKQAGRGYEFNTRLVVEWNEGTGEMLAAGKVTGGYALFRSDKIGVLSGAGPDGFGQGGSYRIDSVPGEDGCDNPYSVIEHPSGALLFQRKKDGRMCALVGNEVRDISQGIRQLEPYTVVGGGLDVARRRVLIGLSSGTILALDYEHPTAESPLGTWEEHTSEALGLEPCTAGATIDGACKFLIADADEFALWTPGSGYVDGASTVAGQILKYFKTTRMQLPGEADIDLVTLSTTVADGQADYVYNVISDHGTDVHFDAGQSDADVSFRSATYRTREAQLEVTELDHLDNDGAGRKFDGVTIQILPYGKVKETTRKIS